MKLLIIRHGDPDYAIDSLTPTGWQEAELLSERISKLDVTAFYVSPLGRAKDTASLTLKRMGRTAEIKDWLREFPAQIVKPSDITPDFCVPDICWDWLPQDWTAEPRFYDRDRWLDVPAFADADVRKSYLQVCNGLDALLADHGYVREGNLYRVQQANEDTIVFFCHFGLECVLLSHLLGISPMVLWHGTCAAPTSVTTLVTEERREGIASFRMSAFGDISHLYVANQPPAFSARFCETYANTDQRHD